jgi:tetratricopeptide (TPR) repeat protein
MERYEALADLNRAIELNPEDAASAFASRGETFRLMDRYEDALADFNRAIELDPDPAWVIASRGEPTGRWGAMTRPWPTTTALLNSTQPRMNSPLHGLRSVN